MHFFHLFQRFNYQVSLLFMSKTTWFVFTPVQFGWVSLKSGWFLQQAFLSVISWTLQFSPLFLCSLFSSSNSTSISDRHLTLTLSLTSLQVLLLKILFLFLRFLFSFYLYSMRPSAWIQYGLRTFRFYIARLTYCW